MIKMTGLCVAIENNTATQEGASKGFLGELTEDFWSNYQVEESSEYKEVKEIEKSIQKLENLYSIIYNPFEECIDSLKSAVDSMFGLYSKAFEEANITQKLIENAQYLFSGSRNKTKEEIKKEKEYKISHYEIIEI